MESANPDALVKHTPERSTLPRNTLPKLVRVDINFQATAKHKRTNRKLKYQKIISHVQASVFEQNMIVQEKLTKNSVSSRGITVATIVDVERPNTVAPKLLPYLTATTRLPPVVSSSADND